MLTLFALSVLAAGPFEADDWAQRPLSEAALDSLMPEDLRLRRNEVFARHGYVFKSADLQETFSKFAWYVPNPAFTVSGLSAVERENVDRLKEREDRFRLKVDERVTAKVATLDATGALVASREPLTASLRCVDERVDLSGFRTVCEARLSVSDASGKVLAQTQVPGLDWEAVAGCSASLALSTLEFGDAVGALLRVESRSQVGDMSMEYTNRELDFVLSGKTLVKVLDLETLKGVRGGPEEPSHLVSVEVSVAEGALPAVTVTTTVDDESAKGAKRSRSSSRTLKWKARAFR